MAARTKDDGPPKRLNRAVGIAEALNRTLDPVLRKRGFASRDIITHWAAMAPPPYDKVAIPDRLSWPRGQRGHEGATLYLRCQPGHGLALSHEGPQIAAAINRYFGYVLVGGVRLSPEPFMNRSETGKETRPEPTAATRADVDAAISGVQDDSVREALRRLGHAVIGKRR